MYLSQLSPGRGEGSDTDMEPTASQSQDCEPTPPLQRHGSKSNFFLPPVEGGDSPRKPPQQSRGPFTRGSPHPRPRGMEASQSRSHTPDPLSPDSQQPLPQRSGPSPTMQQRIKAIGVPTPLAMSSPVRRYWSHYLLQVSTRSRSLTAPLAFKHDYVELNYWHPLGKKVLAASLRKLIVIAQSSDLGSILSELIREECETRNATSQKRKPKNTKKERKEIGDVATPFSSQTSTGSEMNLFFLPLNVPRRSNPGTPTQPRRPDFISVGGPPSYYDFQPPQPHSHHGGPPAQRSANYGSPQRRFLSEGELVRQGGDLAYSRTNNTVDNIRELAGSPQRGVYMWKDTSPGAYGGGGNGVTTPVHHHQQLASQHQR
ncbi:unnamed protein product, partial [Timema podura]|nr:unnamed protein product [Timema podura]